MVMYDQSKTKIDFYDLHLKIIQSGVLIYNFNYTKAIFFTFEWHFINCGVKKNLLCSL